MHALMQLLKAGITAGKIKQSALIQAGVVPVMNQVTGAKLPLHRQNLNA